MSLKTYGPDQVTISFGAILIEQGYDDGEFLTIENNEDSFVVKRSTDGMGTRSKTNDQSATVTIKLMQSSPSNAALSAQHTLDISATGGAGIVPLFINDKSGTSLYTAAEAFIMKPPNVSFDREATAREWTIHAENLIRLDGGNS